MLQQLSILDRPALNRGCLENQSFVTENGENLRLFVFDLNQCLREAMNE